MSKETLIEHLQSAFDSEMFQTEEGDALIRLEDAICYVEEYAPPTREPLDLNKVLMSGTGNGFEYIDGFTDGVLYAEKYHCITGVDDE